MNTKDTNQIWESYVSENRGSSKYDDVQAQLQDLIRQKTEYYADIDPQSAFDVSVEDLESQYSDAGDSEAIAILNDISAKNSLKHEGTDGNTDDLTDRERYLLARQAAKEGKGPMSNEATDDDSNYLRDVLGHEAEDYDGGDPDQNAMDRRDQRDEVEEGAGKTAVYVLSDSHGVYGVYTSPDKWKAARAAHGSGSVMEPEQIFIDSAPLDLS